MNACWLAHQCHVHHHRFDSQWLVLVYNHLSMQTLCNVNDHFTRNKHNNVMCVWRRCMAAAFSTCLTNLHEYCGCTCFYMLKVPLHSGLWFLKYEGSCCFPACWALVEYGKLGLHAQAHLDCWPQPCSVCPTCSAMRNQVYSHGQLLGLWLQAEYSFADVTRRQVWFARLGHERSRPRGRCEGQHQHAAAAHQSADGQLDIILPLFAGWPATFAWHAIQMWIVCGAATLAAAFSAYLGRSSGQQTLSHMTHCHGFQTGIQSLL